MSAIWKRIVILVHSLTSHLGIIAITNKRFAPRGRGIDCIVLGNREGAEHVQQCLMGPIMKERDDCKLHFARGGVSTRKIIDLSRGNRATAVNRP